VTKSHQNATRRRTPKNSSTSSVGFNAGSTITCTSGVTLEVTRPRREAVVKVFIEFRAMSPKQQAHDTVVKCTLPLGPGCRSAIAPRAGDQILYDPRHHCRRALVGGPAMGTSNFCRRVVHDELGPVGSQALVV
jgi:hypothetical protein